MIDEQCAWPSFAFMYPPQPPSSSQSSPLISVLKVIQFSNFLHPDLFCCPFWLRNMYKMSNATTISSACELWLEARSAKYISPHDTKRDLRGPSNDRNSGQALIATEGIYQNKRKSPWRDMLMFCLFSRLFWVINVEINAKSFLFMDSSLVALKQQITISSLIKLSMSPEQIY